MNAVNNLYATGKSCKLYNFLFNPQQNDDVYLIDSHEVFDIYYKCKYSKEEKDNLLSQQYEMCKKRIGVHKYDDEVSHVKNYEFVPIFTELDLIKSKTNDGFIEQRRIEPSMSNNYTHPSSCEITKLPKIISKKLEDIYERELGKSLLHKHSALNDVNALIEIAISNAKMFCGVGGFRKHKFKDLFNDRFLNEISYCKNKE